MKLPWLFFFLIPVFSLTGCAPGKPTIAPTTAITISAPTPTPALTNTPTPFPTVTVIHLTVTPTSVDTLEPDVAKATIEPLLQEPMNCAVPCFWGIIPGETHFDEARIFFGKLGFIPFEGIDRNSPSSGMYFYTISNISGNSRHSSATLFISGNLVKDIVINPDIPRPKEGGPREWIAYSPETLIKRYGSPSDVRFTVSSYGMAGSPPNIAINMIMYFDRANLIVHYDGYGMNPERFCPLTAPFDFVRLWIGPNPPNPPSFETIPLEKATSLTMDQFTQLMLGNSKKACFRVNGDGNQ